MFKALKLLKLGGEAALMIEGGRLGVRVARSTYDRVTGSEGVGDALGGIVTDAKHALGWAEDDSGGDDWLTRELLRVGWGEATEEGMGIKYRDGKHRDKFKEKLDKARRTQEASLPGSKRRMLKRQRRATETAQRGARTAQAGAQRSLMTSRRAEPGRPHRDEAQKLMLQRQLRSTAEELRSEAAVERDGDRAIQLEAMAQAMAESAIQPPASPTEVDASSSVGQWVRGLFSALAAGAAPKAVAQQIADEPGLPAIMTPDDAADLDAGEMLEILDEEVLAGQCDCGGLDDDCGGGDDLKGTKIPRRGGKLAGSDAATPDASAAPPADTTALSALASLFGAKPAEEAPAPPAGNDEPKGGIFSGLRAMGSETYRVGGGLAERFRNRRPPPPCNTGCPVGGDEPPPAERPTPTREEDQEVSGGFFAGLN